MAYLENYEIMASNNLHEMQAMLTQLAETPRVDLVGKGHDVNASLRCAALSDLNLLHVTYGDVPTIVQTYESAADTLLLFVLTDGRARVDYKGDDFEISSAKGLMRNARIPLSARQNAFSSYVVPLPKDTLKQRAMALSGKEACGDGIEFPSTFDLSAANGLHLRNTINHIADALDGPLFGGDNNSILHDSLKDLLLTGVLALVPEFMEQPPSRIAPYYVKRAREYIHAHAAGSITLENLACHAGCGYRTLQIAFNDLYGMSPMAYVSHVRLSLAREELLHAPDGVTVRDVALKCGFIHMGWFSKKYRERFGASPSQTLRMRG